MVLQQNGAQGVEMDTAEPRSVALAKKGLSTGEEFATLMAALLTDVITGEVGAEKANAACRAGGNLIKFAELKQRHGIDPFTDMSL